jgi:hypothetical protein
MFRGLALSLLLAATTLAGTVTPVEGIADPTMHSVARIEYRFVGHREETDSAGRLLVWEAAVSGDLSGTMKWWFATPPPVGETEIAGGQISYYAARWELWSNGTMLLAGISTGKTVFGDGVDGVWDGHGTVTEAGDQHAALLGRRIYETGPVLAGSEPPVSFSGTGLFAVY